MAQIEIFFWGIIVALGALTVELAAMFGLILSQNQAAMPSFDLFVTSIPLIIFFALVEELFKYLIIVKKVEPISLGCSFIFNSLLVGLGFALMEIGLIFYQDGTAAKDLFNLAKIAILHTATAGIMGYVIALKPPRKFATFSQAVFIAFAIHLTFNLLSLKKESFLYSDQIISIFLIILVFVNFSNIFKLPKKLAS